MGTSVCVIDSNNFKLLDLYLHRLERDVFVFAGKLVGRNTSNFFGGIRRRDLLDDAGKFCRKLAYSFQREFWLLRSGGGFAFGIIGVGGKTEGDNAFVVFLGFKEELSHGGHVAGTEGKTTGGHWIKWAGMSESGLVKNGGT